MFIAIEVTAQFAEQLVMFDSKEERDAYVAYWWPFAEAFEEEKEKDVTR